MDVGRIFELLTKFELLVLRCFFSGRGGGVLSFEFLTNLSFFVLR